MFKARIHLISPGCPRQNIYSLYNVPVLQFVPIRLTESWFLYLPVSQKVCSNVPALSPRLSLALIPHTSEICLLSGIYVSVTCIPVSPLSPSLSILVFGRMTRATSSAHVYATFATYELMYLNSKIVHLYI